jgi:hypothetical protein
VRRRRVACRLRATDCTCTVVLRLPWHDVQVQLFGPVAQDVCTRCLARVRGSLWLTRVSRLP